MSLKLSLPTRDQGIKIAKTVAYIAVSAAISAVISYLTDHPDLFGLLTPAVNILLVTLKQFLTEPEE
jgi:hypothetical protein